MAPDPFREVVRAARVMEGFLRPWFIVGGWAVDLHLGRQTRPHEDVDVGLLRADQRMLRQHLRGWTFLKVVPPGGEGRLEVWEDGEWLDLPVHEIHARRERGDPPALEFLLNEARGRRWLYRRDRSVTRPLARAIQRGRLGIPYLAPEVVLLYKAPNAGPEDSLDFDAVVPSLGAEPRTWLRGALARRHPEHPWQNRLRSP